MTASTWAIPLLCMALFLSGCGGKNDPQNAQNTVPASATLPPSEDGGTIVGSVVDDSINPIAGAEVGLVSPSVTVESASDGSFRIANVPAGDHKLFAGKIGYDSAAKTVTVVAGEEVEVRITLIPIEVSEPYPEVFGPFNGYFGCRNAVVTQGTGPCFPIVMPVQELKDSNAWIEFPRHDDATAYVGEMLWTQGTYATSQRLRMSFSHVDRASNEWFCTATSNSPIHWTYIVGEEGGCDAPVYCGITNSNTPSGKPQEPQEAKKLVVYTNTPFACEDTGAPQPLELAVQQKFQIGVTVFHNMMPDEGYSMFT